MGLPNDVFTRDELLAAYMLVMDRRAATSMLDAEVPAPIERPSYRPIPTHSYTDDTLILLSLLSEELHERVRAYRSAHQLDSVLPGEEWEARRQQFKEALRGGRTR